MRLSLASVAVSFCVLTAPACLGTGSSINAYGGTRSFDEDDLDNIDEHTVYGADAVLKLDLPFLATEFGWFHSEDDAGSVGALTDVEFAVDEYFVGLRLTPWDFLIEPYASAGVSLVDGDLDATGAGDSDTAFGYYARLGAAFRLGFIRLGLDGRAAFSEELDLDTIESDVQGVQIAAFLGFAF